MQLNEKLVSLRKQKKITQQSLAKEINYSDKVISKWENGYSVPDIDALKTLSKFYNISMDELVEDCDLVTNQRDKEKFPMMPKLFFHILLIFPSLFMICILFCMPISISTWDTIIPIILGMILIGTSICDLVFVYLRIPRKILLIILFSIICVLFGFFLISVIMYGGLTLYVKPFIYLCVFIIISTAFGFVSNKRMK